MSLADQQQADAFIRSSGIPWLNGFGAEETIKQLGNPPLLFVIDRSGRIVWNDRRARSWHADIKALADLQSRLDSLLNDETPPRSTSPDTTVGVPHGLEQADSPPAQ